MQIKAAEAQLEQAKSTLEYMKSLVDNHFIRAPFDGVVTKIYLKDDAYTDMMLQKPFGIVSSEKNIIVETNLPENYLNDVKVNQPAEVILDVMPDRKWKAKVYRVASELDKVSRTFSVELLINDKEPVIKSGMTASVNIKIGTHKSIAIPYGAIQRYPATGVYFAFVIKNNIIEQRNLVIGTIINDLIEVKSGIEKGEKVVISANRRLVSGMKVKEIED
jgi:RND family efflux transporter MFP subunit